MNLIKQHTITKNSIDIEALAFEVKELSQNAKNIKETYPSIKHALKLLKKNHTSLFTANADLAAYYSTLKCGESINNSVPNLNNIGYIRVNGFSVINGNSVVSVSSSYKLLNSKPKNCCIEQLKCCKFR